MPNPVSRRPSASSIVGCVDPSPRVSTQRFSTGVGWGLYRRDRRDDALAVSRRNRQQFPEEYIPNESLADALWFQGERETAIEMFEAWLEGHPDHAMARRRLPTLKSQL